MISFLFTNKSYLYTFLLLLGMCFSVSVGAAEPTPTLSFQGQLLDNNLPPTGTVSATFTFYDALTGGTQTGAVISKTIVVSRGYVSTQFTSSDTTGVDFNQQLYLEVSINGTPLSPRTTLTPAVSSLKTFGTFSYATPPSVGPVGSLYFNSTTQELYASNGVSWQLAGVSSSTTQWTPNGTSLNYMAGNVGIGTTTPGSKLVVVGTSTFSGNVGINTPSTSDALKVLGASTVINNGYTTHTIHSVGSTPALQFYKSSGTIGAETQVTTASTIGDIVPYGRDNLGGLQNVGQIRFASDGAITSTSAAGNIKFYTVATNTVSLSERMIITSSGNVGIGTSTPGAKLDVSAIGDSNTTNYGVRSVLLNGSNSINVAGYFSSTGASTNFALRTGGGLVDFGGNMTTSGTINTRSLHSSTLGNLFIGDITSGFVAGNGGNIVFAGDSLGQGASNSTFGNIRGIKENSTYNNSLGALIFGTQSNAGASQGLSTVTEKMRISSAGFVGIGTTTPTAKLHVNGTNAAIGILEGSGTSGWLRFDEAGTTRGYFGYGDTGHIFTGASSDSLSLRAEGDLHLGGTGNSLAMTIKGGNVGIGTTTPSAPLHVAGIAKISAGFVDLDTGYSIRWGGTASGIYSGSGSSDMVFTAGSAERLRINGSSGNVGIGTTTPTAKLVVQGGVGTFNTLGGANVRIGNNSTTPSIILDNGVNTFSVDNANGTGLRFVYNGSTVPMVLTASGNVGIGTTTPGSLLTVAGNALFTGTLTTTANSNLFFTNIFENTNSGTSAVIRTLYQNDQGGGASLSIEKYSSTYSGTGARSGGSSALIESAGGGGGSLSLATGGSGAIKFFTGGISTTEERMRILSNGNVGIGTTTPTATLTASGTIRFTSLGSGGANLITDSLGNVTVSSDERLKDIQGDFISGLDQIKGITPITYRWKTETGYDTVATYAGFSAQNVQANIPEAVTTDSRGFLTLADRPILAALVNAVKELAVKFENFGKKVETDELCIKKKDGNRVCLTGEQLESIMANDGINNIQPQTTSPSTSPVEEVPVVTEEDALLTPEPVVTEVQITPDPEPAPVQASDESLSEPVL